MCSDGILPAVNKTHIDLARDRGRAASTLVRVDRLLRDPR